MKKTAKKPEPVSVYASWPKKVVADGEEVTLSAEVNGCPAGTKATVLHSVHGGAILLVRICGGLKAGAEFRVAARDLV